MSPSNATFGMLPSNSVKPRWASVTARPAGFADRVDDQGVEGILLTRATSAPVSIAPGAWGVAVASCPAGSKVTGGGQLSDAAYTYNTDSIRVYSGTAWAAYAHNTDGAAHNIRATAACMSANPPTAITTADQGRHPAKMQVCK